MRYINLVLYSTQRALLSTSFQPALMDNTHHSALSNYPLSKPVCCPQPERRAEGRAGVEAYDAMRHSVTWVSVGADGEAATFCSFEGPLQARECRGYGGGLGSPAIHYFLAILFLLQLRPR